MSPTRIFPPKESPRAVNPGARISVNHVLPNAHNREFMHVLDRNIGPKWSEDILEAVGTDSTQAANLEDKEFVLNLLMGLDNLMEALDDILDVIQGLGRSGVETDTERVHEMVSLDHALARHRAPTSGNGLADQMGERGVHNRFSARS